MAESLLYVLIWTSLVAIAVVDAREHRIPNIGLLIVLILSSLYYLVSPDPVAALVSALLAALVLFVGALLLHIIKVMAPGDVKLLGTIGFVVGWDQCLSTVYWIALTSVIVGILFSAVHVAENPHVFKSTLRRYAASTPLDQSSTEKKQSPIFTAGKLQMPFGPIVVIGLALSHYF